MSELDQQQWSVISERGCEGSSLAYAEAAQLGRELSKQKIHALCIITNEAAERLSNTPSLQTRR